MSPMGTFDSAEDLPLSCGLMKRLLYSYRATLVRVVDGDTVDLDVDLGFRVTQRMRVRLAKIDAPEVRGKERKAGLEATRQLRELLIDAEELFIQTDKDKTGKYGRYLAQLWVVKDGDSIVVNDWMVKKGFAQYREY